MERGIADDSYFVSFLLCPVEFLPFSFPTALFLFTGDSLHWDFSAPGEEQCPRSCLAWPACFVLPQVLKALGTSLLGTHNISVRS